MHHYLYIVTIGGLSGGLRHILDFVSHLPADTGAAFVIITHIKKDYPSELCELVKYRTSMPVIRLQTTQQLQPNHIYVLPENVFAGYRCGSIFVRTRAPDEIINKALDLFLQSLAAEKYHQSISIIFTG